MQKMKQNLKTSNLISHINRLTELWLEWMQNHNMSNDNSKNFKDRRTAGEQCEILQQERQNILQSINDIVEEEWV
jgi:hypothetical protein